MGTLRWILLILGIAVVAIIYFRGRRRGDGPIWPRREPKLDMSEPAAAPSIAGPAPDTEAGDAAAEPGPEHDDEHMSFDDMIVRGLEKEVRESETGRQPGSPPPAADPEPAALPKNTGGAHGDPPMLLDEELVVVHIIAPRGVDFDGRELYTALKQSGFEKRRGDIFYCHGEHGEYMAVNALRPGTFPEEPDDFSTRAVGLILRLSTADKPLTAFDEFIVLVKRINSQLDGRLCDSRRSSLTPQTIGYLRDEVQQYQIKHLKARTNR